MQGETEWQSETRRCGVVLHEVFAWLSGTELAGCGAVCRAWRRAAAAPALWRRLLRRERGLGLPPDEPIAWRQEYVAACAGWRPVERHEAAGGAALLHAALAPGHDALALGAADGSLGVWRRERGAWRLAWRAELRARGWAAVRRVQWARAAPRLLLAGERLLAHDWELLVLHLDDDYGGARVASRARCSPGAAGCWFGGDAFLSLELRLLAPGVACTTVWLNAATQETQSEHAGVTTPLLRIFNETGAHITHALVAGPGSGGLLVAGSARGLAAWPVRQPRPSPLLVGAPGELAERERRRRAEPRRRRADAAPPDEASVRAACAPPELECRLAAPLVGLVLHDSGRWLGAACSDGSVRRVCARSLVETGAWHPAAIGPGPPPLTDLHYVQPATSGRYVACPAGAYSASVRTWARCSGAPAGAAGPAPRQEGAAVCALLPRGGPRAQLITLAGSSLYVWRSRASRQPSPERRVVE